MRLDKKANDFGCGIDEASGTVEVSHGVLEQTHVLNCADT